MNLRPLALVVTFAVATIAAVGVVAGLDGVATPATTESVLLVGDSLLQQAAPGIAAALPSSPVVDGTVGGSGLLDGSVDWLTRAKRLVDRYRPDLVVVSFVGNYDASQGTLVADTPAFYSAWAAAARRLTDQLRASGARVDWVAQPPVGSPNFYGIAAGRTDWLDATYAALARAPGVALVDANQAIATADGGFARRGDVCGAPATLRIADGLHFTSVGGRWWGVHLGRAVATADQLATTDVCEAMHALGATG